jgi:DNA-binding NtrC family response regulator
MMPYSIYVVDDEPVVRRGLSLALKKKGYHVDSYAMAETALAALKKKQPDLILLDIGLPGLSGLEALQEIKRLYPDIIVIMITAYEDVHTVVSAMKHGAREYVVKPIQMDALLVILQNAFDTIAMRKEIQAVHEKYLKENLPCFVGESNVIQDVMEIIKKVAQSPDTPILIQGKTGTGKELVAKAIHYRSPNARGPLVAVNCAAIPRELIESELFGYEKGAFSGADKTGKIGMVEKARGGTLFLDEVGDLSNEAQAKLLRFLEEGEYYRLGGTRKRTARTRIISATNKDIGGLIGDGLFRQDLYFRLAVVKIEVPSLNARRDDIAPIARHFLVEFSRKFGKTFTHIDTEAQFALKEFDWSGNVRELKNVIERGVLLADGPVLALENLFLQPVCRNELKNEIDRNAGLPALAPSGIDFSAVLHNIEKTYFDRALQMADDNESKAAQLLGLSRDKFRYRRQKLNQLIKLK